jgi:serine/threonine protein kinase
VVRLLDGPRQLGSRTVLDLEYAGDESPGARLRAQGRLSYHEPERFSADLFTALDRLAGKAVRHRDIKPDNFGVSRRADLPWQLLLYDFSLTDVPDRDVAAGTGAAAAGRTHLPVTRLAVDRGTPTLRTCLRRGARLCDRGDLNPGTWDRRRRPRPGHPAQRPPLGRLIPAAARPYRPPAGYGCGPI